MEIFRVHLVLSVCMGGGEYFKRMQYRWLGGEGGGALGYLIQAPGSLSREFAGVPPGIFPSLPHPAQVSECLRKEREGERERKQVCITKYGEYSNKIWHPACNSQQWGKEAIFITVSTQNRCWLKGKDD